MSYTSCFNCSPEIQRTDDKIKNKRNTFFVGGSSGCQVHARTHFPIYKARCEAAGIKLHHHALPRKLFRAMRNEEMAKAKGGTRKQSTLDNVVVKEKKTEFTCENLLHEVAKFVVCDDQVCPITF